MRRADNNALFFCHLALMSHNCTLLQGLSATLLPCSGDGTGPGAGSGFPRCPTTQPSSFPLLFGETKRDLPPVPTLFLASTSLQQCVSLSWPLELPGLCHNTPGISLCMYIYLAARAKHDAKLWTGTFKNQCCHRKNCKAKVCTLVQPGRQLICCVVFNFSALHLTFSESLEVLLLLLQPQLTTLRHTNAFRLCIEQNNPVPSREAGGTQVCTYICTPKSGADSVSLNKQYTFISLKIGLLSSFYPTATTNCTVKITLCGSE